MSLYNDYLRERMAHKYTDDEIDEMFSVVEKAAESGQTSISTELKKSCVQVTLH